MAYQKKLPPPPNYTDQPRWRGNSYDVGSRIVRAAWNMLATKDAVSISLRELAQEVGVSAPAAYNHFKDRDQLFGELAWGGLQMLAEELVDLVSDEAETMPKGLVTGTCRVWLDFVEKRPRQYVLMFSGEFNDAKRNPRAVENRNRLRIFLQSVIHAEVGFAPPAAEVDIVLAMLHGAASLSASGGPTPPIKPLSLAISRQLSGMKKKVRSRSKS